MSGTTSFDCPRCGVSLAMSERHGIEIDYCPQCRGVWLDRGELDKIIERAEVVQEPPPSQPTTSWGEQSAATWTQQPPPTFLPQQPWSGDRHGHGYLARVDLMQVFLMRTLVFRTQVHSLNCPQNIARRENHHCGRNHGHRGAVFKH